MPKLPMVNTWRRWRLYINWRKGAFFIHLLYLIHLIISPLSKSLLFLAILYLRSSSLVISMFIIRSLLDPPILNRIWILSVIFPHFFILNINPIIISGTNFLIISNDRRNSNLKFFPKLFHKLLKTLSTGRDNDKVYRYSLPTWG